MNPKWFYWQCHKPLFWTWAVLHPWSKPELWPLKERSILFLLSDSGSCTLFNWKNVIVGKWVWFPPAQLSALYPFLFQLSICHHFWSLWLFPFHKSMQIPSLCSLWGHKGWLWCQLEGITFSVFIEAWAWVQS